MDSGQHRKRAGHPRQPAPGRDHAVRHIGGRLIGFASERAAARYQRLMFAHGFAVTVHPPQRQAEREAG